jgi:hypothetical protein
MTDVATLQTRLDALLEMRSGGVRRARFGDDDVEYATDAELAAAIADLERRIADAQGRRVHTVKIHTSKGF